MAFKYSDDSLIISPTSCFCVVEDRPSAMGYPLPISQQILNEPQHFAGASLDGRGNVSPRQLAGPSSRSWTAIEIS